MKRIFAGLLTLFMGTVMVLPATVPAQADSVNLDPAAPVTIPALMIKVENTIQAGQPATITVLSRSSNETIAGAPVYAIKTGGKVVPAGPGNSTATDGEFEALMKPAGILIGTTGIDGTVSATLAVAGRYLLIATKDGFIPGFARLQVKEEGNKARLSLKATPSSPAGQQVTISVTDRISNQATENATVYALKVENGKDIKQKPPTANNGKAVLSRALNNTEMVREKGVLVGSTDSAGQVTYSFPTPGQYILAAFKAGYLPDFARINIRQVAAVNPVPVPQTTTTTTTDQ
ncbi:MAG: hypothetical protein NT177_08705 [Chloroflexi bacterium]|nr:hypothetical protein [Chloroflexota bacterium]